MRVSIGLLGLVQVIQSSIIFDRYNDRKILFDRGYQEFKKQWNPAYEQTFAEVHRTAGEPIRIANPILNWRPVSVLALALDRLC